jgi:hypothetical protein
VIGCAAALFSARARPRRVNGGLHLFSATTPESAASSRSVGPDSRQHEPTGRRFQSHPYENERDAMKTARFSLTETHA